MAKSKTILLSIFLLLNLSTMKASDSLKFLDGETNSNIENKPTTLRELADQTYLELLNIFNKTNYVDCHFGGDYCNFWQLGNSFDTIVDYLRLNPQKSTEFFEKAILSYEKTSMKKYNTACWFDDFGWWAVGTTRALKFNILFENQSIFDKIDEISRATYSKLHESSEIWDSCSYDNECLEKFNNFEPKYKGGVWNYFWTDEKIDNLCVTPCDPRNPDNTLCGIQNTVTNGLFAHASSLLMESIPKSPYYKQSNLQINKFFNSWMAETEENSIIKFLNNTKSYIFRERISSFKNGGTQRFFDKDLSWAGDNGILLGHFVSSMKTDKQSSNSLEKAKDLIDGIKMYLVNGESKILNWARSMGEAGPSPGNDPWDYNNGLSVLIRNLRTAYDYADLKDYVKSKFSEIMKNLAYSLLINDDGLCTSNECGDLTRLSNRLQVLTFAIELEK